MRRRGIGRFVLALVVLLTLYRLGFPKLLAVGMSVGGWGIATAYFLGAVALTLIFSAIYDGPRALGQLVKTSPRSQLGAVHDPPPTAGE